MIAIALLGIYPKNTKILIRRDTCILMFIAALSTIAKLWKQPKCPSTDKWIDVELESIMLSKISQLDKGKSCGI